VYFLVLLRPAASWDGDIPDHDPFTDSLVERNLILLGGPFSGEPVAGVRAAYVLRCADLDEARAIVAGDPLVASGADEASVMAWDLVGINLAAIDPDLTTT
jgi:uncharacterized protein YciI